MRSRRTRAEAPCRPRCGPALGLVLWLALVAAGAGEPGPGQTAPLSARYDSAEGFLSLLAQGVPLAEVLREVARLTGVRFVGAAGLVTPITTTLESAPLERALGVLLRGESHVITVSGAGEVTVWVLPGGTGSTLPPAPGSFSGGPEAVAIPPGAGALDAFVRQAVPAAPIERLRVLGIDPGETEAIRQALQRGLDQARALEALATELREAGAVPDQIAPEALGGGSGLNT